MAASAPLAQARSTRLSARQAFFLEERRPGQRRAHEDADAGLGPVLEGYGQGRPGRSGEAGGWSGVVTEERARACAWLLSGAKIPLRWGEVQ